METIKGWIQQIYKDNGLIPTVVTMLVLIGVIVALTMLDIQWTAWLK